MTAQQELMHETFHALAQPISALRAKVELGLRAGARQLPMESLAECLPLVLRLSDELGMLREIAALDDKPATAHYDATALLLECVEEMAMVARDAGTTLAVEAEPGWIACHEATLRSAIFLLLDSTLAAEPGSKIEIGLHPDGFGYAISVSPAKLDGLRGKLFCKLMEHAGAEAVELGTESARATFPAPIYRNISASSSGE